MLHEYTFRAMNTGVSAWLWSESPLASVRLTEVETLFAEAEAELSRFRPTSGLSRLNAQAGAWPQRISVLLQAVLGAALDAASDSDGLFDPPFDETKDLPVIGLTQGAIATSSIGKRRWERHGQAMHHLIDSRSGQPSQSDLHTVTVLAPTTVEAEVAAKVALILGQRAGERYLTERGLSGILIGVDGWMELVGKPLIVDTAS